MSTKGGTVTVQNARILHGKINFDDTLKVPQESTVGTGTCTPVQLYSHTSTCTGYSCRLASTIQPAEPTTQAADLKS